jgi:hypothetical protein
MIDVIILAAGDISAKLRFLKSKCQSPALIPVNSRPIASYLINFYQSEQSCKIFLAVEENVKDAVMSEMSGLAKKFQLLALPSTRGVVHTLALALEQLKESEEFIVNVVTTIPTKFPALKEVQIAEEVSRSRTWSAVAKEPADESRVTFLPKGQFPDGLGHAFTGIFRVKAASLRNALQKTAVENDLLAIVSALHTMEPLNYQKTDWIDCGHEINYYNAKAKLISSRSFNNIQVVPAKGILRKSSKQPKLQQEEQFISMLPHDVAVLFPRIIQRYQKGNGSGVYEMEYYGYPNLAEYLLYWDLNPENWQRIFSRLAEILQQFKDHPYSIGTGAYASFYFDRTVTRVQDFFHQLQESGENIGWSRTDIIINELPCKPFHQLLPDIQRKVEVLYKETDFCLMHGDFCFSNILYDVTSGIIRLIDPRGSFGERCTGIYGDHKYDLAKLAHSAIGGYDYIVNGLFTLKRSGEKWEYELKQRGNHNAIGDLCRQTINQLGYREEDIAFITGLLFVSMCSLHTDSVERQLLMYLHGLKILNKCLG